MKKVSQYNGMLLFSSQITTIAVDGTNLTPKSITIEAVFPQNLRGPLTSSIEVYEAVSETAWSSDPVTVLTLQTPEITYRPRAIPTTLGFIADDATASTIIDEFVSRVCLQVDTKSRSRLLWALGASRSVKITGITPSGTRGSQCQESGA
jgi:hypothetical protein